MTQHAPAKDVDSRRDDILADLTNVSLRLEVERASLTFPAWPVDPDQADEIKKAAEALLSQTPTTLSTVELGALLYYIADRLEEADTWR